MKKVAKNNKKLVVMLKGYLNILLICYDVYGCHCYYCYYYYIIVIIILK
jgi:hypothetical protein